MPDISHLPPFLQVAVTMLVLVIGGSLTFFQFTRKWLDKLPPPVRPAPTPAPTDAVVVSAAFADGAPIRELNGLVRKLLEAQATTSHAIEQLTNATRDNTAEQARTTDAVRQNTDRVSALVAVVREVRG